MQKDVQHEEIEESIEVEEEVKFGYTASIVFLIFIGFIIYTAIKN